MISIKRAALLCVMTVAATTLMCLYLSTIQMAHLRQQVDELSKITVGPKGPCAVSIPRGAWDELNNLKFYAWVVACEEQQP